MKTGFSIYETPQFCCCSQNQLEKLHHATLEILERVGVRICSEEGLDILKKAGADVRDEIARIPPPIVEHAIQVAPHRISIGDRNGKRRILLEGTKSYYGTGSDTPQMVDPYSGEVREVLNKDVGKASLLADALPNIDFVMSMGLSSDVPAGTSDIHQFYQMLSNTIKPIVVTAFNRRTLADIIEIAAIIRGGQEALEEIPYILCYNMATSPLTHSREAVEKILLCAEKKVPVIYPSSVIAGATGPASFAGAIVTGNTESLTGLVLAQLKREGTPFVHGGNFSIMDMRTGINVYGGPERLLAAAFFTELSRYYRLPSFGYAGCSDGMMFDEQVALESTLSILTAALPGSNLIHDIGYIGSGMIASYESMVMCDEVIGMIKAFMRNLVIDEETLAVDLVEKVGPGGNFLTEEHTVQHSRCDFWFPRLLNRHNFEEWEGGGGLTYAQRANRRVRELFETYQSSPLPEKVHLQIKEIIKDTDRRESSR